MIFGMQLETYIYDMLCLRKIVEISLHYADPQVYGEHEISGAGYQRFVVKKIPSDPIVFENLPTVTVTHFGVWVDGGYKGGNGFIHSLKLLEGDNAELKP